MPVLHAPRPAQLRTRLQLEAAISEAMDRFERDRMGRAPGTIRTRIAHDVVLVRMVNVLSPAERALLHGGEADLVKQMRMRLLEGERATLAGLLQTMTGCRVGNVYGDLCPRTGERMLLFTLEVANVAGWPPAE